MMNANDRTTKEELIKAVGEAKGRRDLELKDIQALIHLVDHYPEMVENMLIKSTKDLNEEEKKFGLKLALEMALADNSFESSEKEILKKMIEYAGFDPHYYDSLISGNG